MKIYNYHPITNEFLSESIADVSPLEQNNFIIPASATTVARPLIKANEAALFSVVSGTWSIVPDFRGQTVYDQTTGVASVVANLGALPENLGLTIPAAFVFANAKTAQIAIMASNYAASIQNPVAYMTTTFQADSGSQDVLTKCLVAGSVPAGFYWLDANNAQVPMTFAQLQGLAGAMLTQGQTAFARLQTRKSTVLAATTVAAVQAVVW